MNKISLLKQINIKSYLTNKQINEIQNTITYLVKEY